jgi:hypothetical protein
MLLSSCTEHRGRALLNVKGRHRVTCVFTSSRAHTPYAQKKKKKFAPVTRMVVVTRRFVTGYTDSDWGGSMDDIKITSAYIFHL